MGNLSNIELSEICIRLGKSNIINTQQIWGGSINNSWKINFDDSIYFLKKNERSQKLLEFENYCLKDLEQYIDFEDLSVPRVFDYFVFDTNEYLLLEWIEMNNDNQKKLGKGLAKMHLNSNKKNPSKFGYSKEGFIGTNKQIKGWEDNWVDCFLELRIEPQISLFKNNFLDRGLINQIKSKVKFQLSNHEPMNSLIHGDLWSGNAGSGSQGEGIIFDPSCWWADSEVDLAMTRLFGGFTKDFYKEYNRIIQPKKGLEIRIDIYNFYHILNHANMFGGSYISQVDKYIKRILDI